MLGGHRSTYRFLTDVSKVATGNVLSRLIVALSLPFVTSLHSPHDLQTYSVFQSLLTALLIISCLRFEVAVALAKTNSDAANLGLAAICTTLIAACCSGATVALFGERLIRYAGTNSIDTWQYTLPIAILAGGIANVFQYILTREELFTRVALARTAQATGTVLCMVSTGLLFSGPLGLIASTAVGFAATLPFTLRPSLKFLFANTYLQGFALSIKENSQYATLVAPSALIQHLGSAAPLIIVAATTGVNASYFFLGLALVTTPAVLVGQAIGQSLVGHLNRIDHEGTTLVTLETLLRAMIYLGCFPILLAGWTASLWVPLLFSADYYSTITVVEILSPAAALAFISYPLSGLLLHRGKTKQLMIMRCTNATAKIGTAIGIGILSPEHIVLGFGAISLMAELFSIWTCMSFRTDYRPRLIATGLTHLAIACVAILLVSASLHPAVCLTSSE